MGWIDEDPKHEGFLIALVPTQDLSGWIDLSVGPPDAEHELVLELQMFAVGCECGWRSRRFHAPPGTRYMSHIVVMTAQDVEDEARELWRRHVKTELGLRLRHLRA